MEQKESIFEGQVTGQPRSQMKYTRSIPQGETHSSSLHPLSSKRKRGLDHQPPGSPQTSFSFPIEERGSFQLDFKIQKSYLKNLKAYLLPFPLLNNAKESHWVGQGEAGVGAGVRDTATQGVPAAGQDEVSPQSGPSAGAVHIPRAGSRARRVWRVSLEGRPGRGPGSELGGPRGARGEGNRQRASEPSWPRRASCPSLRGRPHVKSPSAREGHVRGRAETTDQRLQGDSELPSNISRWSSRYIAIPVPSVLLGQHPQVIRFQERAVSIYPGCLQVCRSRNLKTVSSFHYLLLQTLLATFALIVLLCGNWSLENRCQMILCLLLLLCIFLDVYPSPSSVFYVHPE
ncbi:uncharacterized protein [Manis javanica]|uniref:uncharacterized protein n=1 Tax=Manis javanica TaxID=9974 RepID=UPI003C6D5292